MKTIIKYQCEICGYMFRTEDQCRGCEADGLHPLYPVGLIEVDSSYRGGAMAFAIAEVKQVGHGLEVALWACRDTGHGDNPPDQLSANRSSFSYKPVPFKDSWRGIPCFQRIVALLHRKDVPPLVWHDGAAVPFSSLPAAPSGGKP